MRIMAWCMISMVLGVLIFGAGVAFERFISADMPQTITEPEQEKLPEKEDTSLLGQWKNLLDYDGTIQEEYDYENR